MQRQKVDPTLMRYLGNILSVALNIILVVGILGYCGIETTSFAALVAGVGIAVGAAWGGLLSNLAAGAFLIVLKPSKVGDFISAAGVTATVKEIGIFATAIDTPDNVMTIIGNNKIVGDNIQNFSTNAFRRTAVLSYRSLLAGVLRRQPRDPRIPRGGRLPGANTLATGVNAGGLTRSRPAPLPSSCGRVRVKGRE